MPTSLWWLALPPHVRVLNHVLGVGLSGRARARKSGARGQRPPATVISLPVTNDASGESSHDTAFAISPGRPFRPSGLCSAASRSCVDDVISVSMMPGETLLTRTPSEATSLDRP